MLLLKKLSLFKIRVLEDLLQNCKLSGGPDGRWNIAKTLSVFIIIKVKTVHKGVIMLSCGHIAQP